MKLLLNSHKSNITYWAQINSTGWHMEVDGMRTMLNAFGQIPVDEIKGNLTDPSNYLP